MWSGNLTYIENVISKTRSLINHTYDTVIVVSDDVLSTLIDRAALQGALQNFYLSGYQEYGEFFAFYNGHKIAVLDDGEKKDFVALAAMQRESSVGTFYIGQLWVNHNLPLYLYDKDTGLLTRHELRCMGVDRDGKFNAFQVIAFTKEPMYATMIGHKYKENNEFDELDAFLNSFHISDKGSG